jgi:hypothetical protein
MRGSGTAPASVRLLIYLEQSALELEVRQVIVAWFELDYAPTNRFHLAGYSMPEPAWLCDRWFAQPEQYAKDVRRASQRQVRE